MLLGAAVVPFALVMRRTLPETLDIKRQGKLVAADAARICGWRC